MSCACWVTSILEEFIPLDDAKRELGKSSGENMEVYMYCCTSNLSDSMLIHSIIFLNYGVFPVSKKDFYFQNLLPLITSATDDLICLISLSYCHDSSADMKTQTETIAKQA